jgi:hypothetical protein
LSVLIRIRRGGILVDGHIAVVVRIITELACVWTGGGEVVVAINHECT